MRGPPSPTVPRPTGSGFQSDTVPKNDKIAGSGTVTWGRGGSGNTQPGIPEGRAICWADDNLDTGDTEVMLVIANGPGYTVDPANSRHTFTIRDNDDCRDPAATPGGVVYRMNGSSTCICATESRVSDVRRALTPITRPFRTAGPDGIFGNDDDVTETRELTPSSPGFLKQLAAQFHDPPHLYCPDSPYRGLPE